jgi:hypothetical protein
LAPFSTSRFGSPLAAGVPRPATFRLQGLATLLTAYSFRARAGFVSPRQRSWDSPFGAFPSREGIRGVSARKHPPAVFPAGTAIVETMTRSGRPRLLGFAPCESPSRSARVFSTAIRRLLPWVFPLSGFSCECLDRDPSRSPLTRFAGLSRRRMPSRRPRVSISSRLASSRPAANSRPRTRQPS